MDIRENCEDEDVGKILLDAGNKDMNGEYFRWQSKEW
jgi:hypothetical protein